MITDNSFDVLCLTETWLKPNDYIGLNESTPPSYCYKHEPHQTGRGGSVATIYSDILNVTQKTGYRFNSFEILLLNVTLSDMQNKSVLSLALATVYRPPGPYTDFLKEFADFLSDLLVNVDKALIVRDFNMHVDNTNDALGLAFTDLINSFGVKKRHRAHSSFKSYARFNYIAWNWSYWYRYRTSTWWCYWPFPCIVHAAYYWY